MSAESDDYNASKILVLEGALGIRKRPAMYIGSTGPQGVMHLLYEVIDNAVDEAMAGYAKNITIHISEDNAENVAEVSDDGRGIPIDIMPKYNKSALEVIMTTLHKGAKFGDGAYKVAGGLHGVGLTVVNALSVLTEVKVRRGGKVYQQTFSRGNATSSLEVIGEAEGTGTAVRFKPDPEIFHQTTFDSTLLKERIINTSFLNRGVNIKLVDDRFGQHDETTYSSKEGLVDFIRFINKGKEPITDVIHSMTTVENVIVEYAIQYNNSYDERLESFVNNIKTTEGGTHVTGFRSGISKAIINYVAKNKAYAKTESKIIGEDVREGLSVVLSVLMQNAEFEGQTKEKLGNTNVKNIVESDVYSTLSQYLEEHPKDAKAIVEKSLSAATARESARKAREFARKRSILESAVLPGKLADSIEDDPDKTEIFIVEGQSAGGSSKEGRDKRIQAILPLRGKILNVEKASYERIFENEEIKSMITAFGTGIKETFNPDNIRYKKIIIMTDADVDGSHIRTLLLTFFYRYMKRLIELGYVYIAQPPLYKVSRGKEIYYCYSDGELSQRIGALKNPDVQRYKGLGEMNPEQLWETTMNPETRTMKRVTIKDTQNADSLFTILMGIDVEQRRRFLHDHSEEVNFLDV